MGLEALYDESSADRQPGNVRIPLESKEAAGGAEGEETTVHLAKLKVYNGQGANSEKGYR